MPSSGMEAPCYSQSLFLAEIGRKRHFRVDRVGFLEKDPQRGIRHLQAALGGRYQ